MSIVEHLPIVSFPDDLDEEEQETLIGLSEMFLDAIPFSSLATLAADEIFETEIDNPDENLFLNKIIDETSPIQGEFAARLASLFDDKKLKDPDHMFFQVLGRKAG